MVKRKIDYKIWLFPIFFIGLTIGVILMGTLCTLNKPKFIQEIIKLDKYKETCYNKTLVNYNSCKKTEYECIKNTSSPCMAYCSYCNETMTYSICEKGKAIELKCIEEVCPIGSRWRDGSKVCYDESKLIGIVKGIGCKKYNGDGFIYELNYDRIKYP